MPTNQPFTKSGGHKIEFQEIETIIPLYILSVESNSSEQQQYLQKRFRIYFDTQIFEKVEKQGWGWQKNSICWFKKYI